MRASRSSRRCGAGRKAASRSCRSGSSTPIRAELARQVARFTPAALVLLDHAENGLYFIERELGPIVAPAAPATPGVPLHAVVGDLCDPAGVDALFAQHRPEIVLHAAAHKH